MGVVPYGTVGPVKVAMPVGATADDFWLASRIVYRDRTENPTGAFDPATSGPLVVSDVSRHCGPTYYPSGGTCTAAIPPIPMVQAVKLQPALSDVRLTWTTVVEAKDGYDVWAVLSKGLIAEAKRGGSPAPRAVCVPTPGPCDDLGAVAGQGGTLFFYQVKGICGSIEGP